MSMGILNLILLTNWPRRYLCHYPGLFNRPVPDDLLVFVGLGPVAPTIRHSIIHCSVNILINPLIDLFADGISSLMNGSLSLNLNLPHMPLFPPSPSLWNKTS
ncbi:hypothetical protein PGT21_009150 [Puccinia graminis f. sp. tritici]|uniref:Uncharacterized protein n=1 Tax=Puccinia graminis f. sp. tritici TaxID=56615 RepID=A0A5B0NN02_PUCGR|nr:hypothetical protein PGT21_009150 [Puccinia graminis f. sp. tritici]